MIGDMADLKKKKKRNVTFMVLFAVDGFVFSRVRDRYEVRPAGLK